MGNFFTNPQGRPDDTGCRILRRRLPYSTGGFGTAPGIPIGAIERGGVILRAYAIVNTAFNAGTTNTLTLGDASVVDSLVTNANAAPGTAGVKQGSGVKIGAEVTADTVIYATFTQAGTAATAGDVTFVVEYAPAYPWSDLNGGQAT